MRLPVGLADYLDCRRWCSEWTSSVQVHRVLFFQTALQGKRLKQTKNLSFFLPYLPQIRRQAYQADCASSCPADDINGYSRNSTFCSFTYCNVYLHYLGMCCTKISFIVLLTYMSNTYLTVQLKSKIKICAAASYSFFSKK